MRHRRWSSGLVATVVAAAVVVAACGPPPAAGPLAGAGAAETQVTNAVSAFMSWVGAGQTSFHVHLDATASELGVGSVGTEDLDVVGPNYAGTIDIKEATKTYKGDVVVLNGIGYAKLPGKTWQRSTVLDLLESPDPFASIPRTIQVYDLGAETRGGTAVEHLRMSDWIFGDPADYLGLPSGTAHVVSVAFDVWVTPDGKPVAAQVDATVTDLSSGIQVPVTIRQVYTITRAGQPITIVAPV